MVSSKLKMFEHVWTLYTWGPASCIEGVGLRLALGTRSEQPGSCTEGGWRTEQGPLWIDRQD